MNMKELIGNARIFGSLLIFKNYGNTFCQMVILLPSFIGSNLYIITCSHGLNNEFILKDVFIY